jgi:hypothetical protein
VISILLDSSNGNFKMNVTPFFDDADEEVALNAFFACEGAASATNRRRGGSVRGKAPNKRRDFVGANTRILESYFVDRPLYDEAQFERRFRVSRNLFNRIRTACERHPFFQQRPNCAGTMGAFPLQKLVAVFRVLAYGLSFDSQDELSQLSESTVRVALREFVLIILRTFENDYLRLPDRAEAKFLLADMENRGFPGCVMSLDCTHI